MTPSAGRDVLGVNLVLPSAWYEIDIHPATCDDSISQAVRERVAQRPELAYSKSALTKTLRRVAREARTNGVVFCGALAELIEDEEAPAASATIAVIAARNDKTGEYAPNTPDAIMPTLGEIPQGRRPTDPWRRVTTVVPPEVGWTAVRTAGIEDIELPNDARPLRMVMTPTFVPFPGGDPRVAPVGVVSTQLALTEPLLELFEHISDTFSFVHESP